MELKLVDSQLKLIAGQWSLQCAFGGLSAHGSGNFQIDSLGFLHWLRQNMAEHWCLVSQCSALMCSVLRMVKTLMRNDNEFVIFNVFFCVDLTNFKSPPSPPSPRLQPPSIRSQLKIHCIWMRLSARANWRIAVGGQVRLSKAGDSVSAKKHRVLGYRHSPR